MSQWEGGHKPEQRGRADLRAKRSPLQCCLIGPPYLPETQSAQHTGHLAHSISLVIHYALPADLLHGLVKGMLPFASIQR